MADDTLTLRVPIFKPGQFVQYRGQSMKVNYVLLRNSELRVFLHGQESSVDPDELTVVPTEFVYSRNRP